MAPTLTLSPATRQSAARASVNPLPSAYPVIAATVGFGIAPSASTASRPTCAAPTASSAVSVCSTATSSPAEKISWPPNRITAATSSREPSSSAAAMISRHTWRVRAFFGGRDNKSVAMPGCSSMV